MKYFIVSDIHSNLEALESVLDEKDSHHSDSQLVCLGDIVGYGPSPNECIEMIFERTEHTFLGNHDSAVTGSTSSERFNSYAREAIQWTREHISRENLSKLRSMHLGRHFDDFLAVHASPSDPRSWIYITSIYAAYKEFKAVDDRVIFIGHTHIPAVFSMNNEVEMTLQDSVDLDRDKRYIINAGSVGQPRNGDPRACCAVFDTEKMEVMYIKKEYDIDKTAKKIRDAGLPGFLSDRLKRGV
ncbi:MAG: metallophosphoesterase family protein [bacterium]